MILKEQVNLSDMTEKIRSIERVRPNYTIGMQLKQNEIDKKEEQKLQEKSEFISSVK